MNWIVTFTDTGMKFTSDYARATFLDWRKKNPIGKYKLVPNDQHSNEQRGFYFGAVIPAYAKWSDNYDHKNGEHLEQVHYALRTAFNGVIMPDIEGKPLKMGKSTSTLSKKEYSAFSERVERYFNENQIPFPDASLYVKWRDQVSMDYKTFDDRLEHMNMKCNGEPITLE